MENAITKGKRTRTRERNEDIMVSARPDMALEEVLEACPFTRKKYEDAVAQVPK
ncbi:hypothetical protein [Chitinophaga sp. CF418]|uniref:hypothetical protein n=1 Tax=Chitinophaga sp. CF418 TaxID=1855287 RepID=UPI000924239A|nr:hypothetical protein [Chitinophaga sp. CF418]SHN39987.1 hypothetical protein SAMN05216311_111284 [Chitinophaga sp. CF418]